MYSVTRNFANALTASPSFKSQEPCFSASFRISAVLISASAIAAVVVVRLP